MQINQIGSTQATSFTGTAQKAQKLPKMKPDSFQKSEFNIEDAMATLKSVKYSKKGKESPKFNNNDLKNLQKILNKTPEKWNSVKILATTPFIKNNTVMGLAAKKTDVLDAMVPFATEPNVVKAKGGKYSHKDIMLFADNATAEQITAAKPLIKTQLSGENVAVLSLTPELDGKLDKVASKTLDMEKAMGSNLKEIVFDGDAYDTSAFVIKAATKDDQLNTELLDKNLNRSAIENMSMYQSGENVYQIKKVSDVRNNTTSKVRLVIDAEGYPTVTNEVRVIKDKNGKVVKKEYTAPSEVNGIFDIKSVDTKGNEKIISSGKVDKKSGLVSVEKHMESLDGTKTDYLYQDDPQGNRISEYKIVDKNGKTLLEKNSTFEIVNDHKVISTMNKDKYEITYTDKDVNVQDMNNPKRHATIQISNKIAGNKKEILKSLKAMPGEELFKVAETTSKLVGTTSVLESYYDPSNKEIHTGGNLFIILHELGHARDNRDADGSSDEAYAATVHKTLSENKEIQKVYDEERNAFNKAFPDTQRDHVDYFINKVTHYGGELGGLGETIAESNALLTTPKTHELLAIRSQYLQQYFPKTIAKLEVELNKSKA